MFWFKMSSAVYVVGCFPFSLNSCTLSSNSIISACYQNWWQESWSHTGLPLWGQTSKTHCKMGLHVAKQRQMYLLSKNTTVGLTSGHVSPKQRHRNSKCLFKPAMEFTTPYRSCQNHITSQFFSPPILAAHQKLSRTWSLGSKSNHHLCCWKNPACSWWPGGHQYMHSFHCTLSAFCRGIEHALLSPWIQHESNRQHLGNVFTRTLRTPTFMFLKSYSCL